MAAIWDRSTFIFESDDGDTVTVLDDVQDVAVKMNKADIRIQDGIIYLKRGSVAVKIIDDFSKARS